MLAKMSSVATRKICIEAVLVIVLGLGFSILGDWRSLLLASLGMIRIRIVANAVEYEYIWEARAFYVH